MIKAPEAMSILERINKKYGVLRDPEIYCKVVQKVGDVRASEMEAIRDLLTIINVIDGEVKNMIGLADLAVEDAHRFEKAVLSTQEGRDLVQWLSASPHGQLADTRYGRSSPQ